METIVERVLKARVRSSGEEIAVRVLIGRPHWTIENTEAACPLSIEGLYGDEDCTEEIEACSELCAAAQVDPDRKHVYGGSMTQCMKNCLPERCGGEPTWKGYK